MDDYNRGGHTKYSLKVHLIFVTKYRKPLFYGLLKDDVKQYFFDSAQEIKCSIIQMETDKDHVHILLAYQPDDSISKKVQHLKQSSTHDMWKTHSDVLSKSYWKKRILWSDGYFACSIGCVSQKTIEQYIKNQG